MRGVELPMLDKNNPIKILRMLAQAGPPLRYNEGEDLEDNRKDGTYDCSFCGPQSFTLAEAFDACCHGEECPWRLAKELVDKIDSERKE